MIELTPVVLAIIIILSSIILIAMAMLFFWALKIRLNARDMEEAESFLKTFEALVRETLEKHPNEEKISLIRY